jgi:hypothetical protein
MSDQKDEVPPPTQPPAPQPPLADSSRKDLKLPAFWSESPASWFLYAESRFRLRDVSSEGQKFDNLVAALPRESVRLVLDVLENPSPTALLHTAEGSAVGLSRVDRLPEDREASPDGRSG